MCGPIRQHHPSAEREASVGLSQLPRTYSGIRWAVRPVKQTRQDPLLVPRIEMPTKTYKPITHHVALSAFNGERTKINGRKDDLIGNKTGLIERRNRFQLEEIINREFVRVYHMPDIFLVRWLTRAQLITRYVICIYVFGAAAPGISESFQRGKIKCEELRPRLATERINKRMFHAANSFDYFANRTNQLTN